MVINVSQGKSYLTQRNNAIRPLETCAPTSLMMMLMYSGYRYPEVPKGTQPEDALTLFINEDPEVQEFYKRLDPRSAAAKVPANEFHAVNEFAVNKWIALAGETRRIRFSTGTPLQNIILALAKGKAVVVSGTWAGLGHVVCVVGLETDQDLSIINHPHEVQLDKVLSFIVDDPYGDYKTRYRSRFGDNVIVPIRDYLQITKVSGSTVRKWAYIPE